MAPARPDPIPQPNLGISVMPFFHHLKAPWWRFSAFEDLSRPNVLAMWNRIDQLRATLPPAIGSLVSDVELCGSYVFGSAHLLSDFDLCFVVPEEHAVRMFNAFDGPQRWITAKNFAADMRTASWDLGIRISATLCRSNRLAGIPCYSRNDMRFYNKADREQVNHRYAWDRTLEQFTQRPQRTGVRFEYGDDPWN